MRVGLFAEGAEPRDLAANLLGWIFGAEKLDDKPVHG